MASQPKALVNIQKQDSYAVPCLAEPKDGPRTARDLIEKVQAVVLDIHSYDSEETPATEWAIQTAKNIITATGDLIKIPMASVVPLDGGVRIAWKYNKKHLRLFCAQAQSRKSYIYKGETEGRKMSWSKLDELGAVTLAKGLHWVQQP